MNPNTDNTPQDSHGGGDPQTSGSVSPQHSHTNPPHKQDHTHAQRSAAADVIRAGIDHLYDEHGQVPTNEPHQPAQQAAAANTNPYMRTHNDTPTNVDEQWKAYHTAWQTYYQQYYQAYYHHHLEKAKASVVPTKVAEPERAIEPHAQPHNYFTSSRPTEMITSKPAKTQTVNDAELLEDEMTKDEALYELRQKLLMRVSQSARRVRKSRHFVPIAVASLAVLLFVFIQYNKVFIGTVAAYVSPGSLSAQDVVIDPTTNITVSQDPRVIIPKINVDVPVAYNVGNDYDSQMSAMKSGLAHFAIPGASSHPGEVGNTVVAGHSSNDLFDSGDYKFIFAQLEKMVVGDTFYANYNGTRYTYVVSEIKVVAPTDVQSIVFATDKPMMTLLTCTPLGTSLNRLLVIGEQVSPDPAAAAQPSSVASTEQGTLSGANTPSLFERLFGAR